MAKKIDPEVWMGLAAIFVAALIPLGMMVFAGRDLARTPAPVCQQQGSAACDDDSSAAALLLLWLFL